jgi:hypothetical protein
VKTIAGQQDVALQLVEQSPGTIVDQAILQDLTADYNMKVDQQVLLGTGANGQVTGLLPIANWSGNTVTWTSSTPHGPGLQRGAERGRLEGELQPLRPRATSRTSCTRAAVLVRLDARRRVRHVRPPAGQPAPRPATTSPLSPPPACPRGPDRRARRSATAIYIDGNMPIIATAGGAITGGSSDLALGAHWDDLWLFEGQVRTRVLSEVLSGTLQVRFQLYNYVAFLARYGQSISAIIGTGMAAPTFAGDTSITF